ncbi:IS66 family transposase [Selenomonas sp. WCT3]|uniref:IS66 family transposase n=1 Tax=Selenomonas sp. WCT3 TaxID=3158785 RepID=UPI0009443062
MDSQSHVLCWAHVRRYFVDDLPQGLSLEEADASISGQVIKRINELFALEKELTDNANKTLRIIADAIILVFILGHTGWFCGYRGDAVPHGSLGCMIRLYLW